jgi:hypothetical protein
MRGKLLRRRAEDCEVSESVATGIGLSLVVSLNFEAF